MHQPLRELKTLLRMCKQGKLFGKTAFKQTINLQIMHITYFITFSYQYTAEKVLFWIYFSKWRFRRIYTFWGPMNLEITFSTLGLCVCMRGHLQHNSKKSRNSKFVILYLHHTYLLLETFHDYRNNNQCTAAPKRILIYSDLWTVIPVSAP